MNGKQAAFMAALVVAVFLGLWGFTGDLRAAWFVVGGTAACVAGSAAVALVFVWLGDR